MLIYRKYDTLEEIIYVLGLQCKKYLQDSWIGFDQTFLGLGLGLGKFFPVRESLVSDIPAGDGNTAEPFFYSVALH